MPKWTDEQLHAISARNSNIIVSAAAGSGKTAVLVQRVINMITDDVNPVDIDKLLIVTFTNAAAAEMKSRIASSLNEIIVNNPNDTNARKQIQLLSSAKICTIDSFCIHLVRENFFKLDIEQDFKILDDSESKLISQTAVEKVVDELYGQDTDEFKLLVELLSDAKSDDNFIQSIKNIHEYIMAQPFPIDWLKTSCELYNPAISINDSALKSYVTTQVMNQIALLKEIIENSKSVLVIGDDMFDVYTALLDSDMLILEKTEALLNSPWNELKSYLDTISFSKLPRAKKGYSEEIKGIIKNNRDLFKKIITKEIVPLFSVSEEEYLQDCSLLYPITDLLCRIVEAYNNEMFALKKEANAYTFSDIEHFAINLLFYKNEAGDIEKTELAEEYQNTFYEILVDEYQDTNSAQDSLFEMISNGKNRFMVGDVKQSIYRFRLAMPHIFNQKKDSYKEYSSDNSEVNQKIILDKNFRSRDGICDFTNFLFSNLMTKNIGELDYTAEEYLNYGALYDSTDVPCASVKIIKSVDNIDSTEYEAMHAARLILKKIKDKEQIWDRNTESFRDIAFGDFAVLFRSAKSNIPVFTRVFSEYGIPVISNNKTNLFETYEVSILISFLKVIDNPSQDIELLSTLMSVFYGYTAEDIASAKVNFHAASLYASIVHDEAHFSKFIEDLRKYREYAASMSVENFVRQVISETSYISVISAMGNAEQRKLNVMKIIEFARNFDNGESVGLTAFMRYVDSIKSAGLSVESASVSNTGNDNVHLMSIHQSKGLEFPVVILAGAKGKYNTADTSSLIQLHPEIGVGLKVNNEEQLYRYNSFQYSCIRDMNICSVMSENLRVLYVAVTRAKEQFITLVSDKAPESHIASLAKKLINSKISPSIVKRIQRDSDLILLCALLHKDGQKLRECTDIPIISNPEYTFTLDVEFMDEICQNEGSEADTNTVPATMTDEIQKKLSYQYDRYELSNFSSKRAASSLDEREKSFKFFAKTKPAFLNSSNLTAAQKGTAMHEFMQHCDYLNSKNNLGGEIERLVNDGFLTKLQAESLDKKKLNQFFDSELAKRMFESDHIYREIKVSSFVRVSQLEDTSFNDKVLIQGIADCVFEENGELVLVDYKTDKVNSEEELLDLYKNQIKFYKSAVSKTLGKNVKTAMLYSFSLGKECVYK